MPALTWGLSLRYGGLSQQCIFQISGFLMKLGCFDSKEAPPPPPSRPYMAGDSKAEHICDSNKQDPFLERLEIWVYASALGFRVQGLRFCKL